MQSIKQFVKGEYQNYDARELLQQPVTVLIGANQDTAEALKLLDIHSVFDLAASRIFTTAYEITKASEGEPSALSKHGFVASDSINNKLRGTSVTELTVQSIDALDGIGPNNVDSLRQSIQLETIRDFSYWAPFQSARQILNSAFIENTEYEDPDAPSELLPKAGEYATEKAYYSSIFLDEVIQDDQEKLIDLSSGEFAPIDLSQQIISKGFSKPATGVILTFEQAWYPEGVALGQLLHSIALAPAESTKVAIIDWTRRTSTSADENVYQAEDLSNELQQKRSITETVEAVAKESQSGFSNTFGFSKSKNQGGAGGVSLPALNMAFSSGLSENTSNAMSVSTSKGKRQITGETLQDIDSSTQQNAASVRNRHASIIREVGQSESESITTRTITNYNHSHALSVHYYEVVQIYRTITHLSKYDRCIFIPMKVLDFSDAGLIYRYRNILQNSVPAGYRQLFNSVQGSVTLTRVKDADLEYIKDTPEKSNYKIFEQQKWLQNADSTLTSISVMRDNGIIDSIEIELKDQDSGPTKNINYKRQSGGIFLIEPYKIIQIQKISYSLGSNELPGNGKYRFIIELKFSRPSLNEEITTQIGFTVDRKQDQPLTSVPLLHVPGNLDTQRLVHKLNEDPLYYSQKIWNNLSSQEVAMVLSAYRKNGERLVEYVDTQPLTVHGNYLVLKYFFEDDKWKAWKNKHVDENSSKQQKIPMATGGTFAEAVLGRFNASEKLDITRFWNWQESPIPIQAPNISPIQAGSRKEADNTTPGQLAAPVVNIMNPPSLPAPQGMGAVLNTLSSSNMFRDMSGLAATTSLAQQALKESSEGATSASAQAGQNLKTITDLEKARLEMIGKLLGGGLSQSGVSKIGALLNHGAQLDSKKVKIPGQESKRRSFEGAQSSFEGAQTENSNNFSSGGSDTGDNNVRSSGSATTSYEGDAFREAIGANFSLAAASSTPVKSVNTGVLPDLSDWKDLMSLRPPHNVQSAMIAAQHKIQAIEQAYGQINLDYYPVEITKLPTVNGKRTTAEEFLEYFRLNINTFIAPHAEFNPYDTASNTLWKSNKPLAAITSITLLQVPIMITPSQPRPYAPPVNLTLEKGSVVVSETTPNHWIFSTVWTTKDGWHPVSGNRKFGIKKKKGSNSYVIYTRGADRVTTWMDYLGSGIAFLLADKLWIHVQQQIVAYINANNGSASVGSKTSNRYNWESVKSSGYYKPKTTWLKN